LRGSSWHFAALEAGAIAQLLEQSALQHQIGLCQIGLLNFDRIRPLFALDENCRLVHSLLGGLIEANQLTDTIVPAIGRSDFVLPSDEREEGEI
jgi:hypothetical protein